MSAYFLHHQNMCALEKSDIGRHPPTDSPLKKWKLLNKRYTERRISYLRWALEFPVFWSNIVYCVEYIGTYLRIYIKTIRRRKWTCACTRMRNVYFLLLFTFMAVLNYLLKYGDNVWNFEAVCVVYVWDFFLPSFAQKCLSTSAFL